LTAQRSNKRLITIIHIGYPYIAFEGLVVNHLGWSAPSLTSIGLVSITPADYRFRLYTNNVSWRGIRGARLVILVILVILAILATLVAVAHWGAAVVILAFLATLIIIMLPIKP
jgi:hypothetical protein